MAKDSRLARAGVSGFNKPKRTPSHKTKSHVVVAKDGNQIKTINNNSVNGLKWKSVEDIEAIIKNEYLKIIDNERIMKYNFFKKGYEIKKNDINGISHQNNGVHLIPFLF